MQNFQSNSPFSTAGRRLHQLHHALVLGHASLQYPSLVTKRSESPLPHLSALVAEDTYSEEQSSVVWNLFGLGPITVQSLGAVCNGGATSATEIKAVAVQLSITYQLLLSIELHPFIHPSSSIDPFTLQQRFLSVP